MLLRITFLLLLFTEFASLASKEIKFEAKEIPISNFRIAQPENGLKIRDYIASLEDLKNDEEGCNYLHSQIRFLIDKITEKGWSYLPKNIRKSQVGNENTKCVICKILLELVIQIINKEGLKFKFFSFQDSIVID